ncbi:MAG: serine protease, partial [Ilumatobacter sp.]|nr:serine protease [Ilumatobacter sp.]
MIQHTTRRLAGVVALAAALAACGGGDDAADTPDTTVPAAAPTSQAPTTVAPTTAAPTDTTAPTSTPTETTQPTGGLVTVQHSVIQIEATGTFVDPEFGAYEGAGRGSGFLIDMGGSTGQGNIAVTNNHVVTGAGKLEVWVYDEDTPRNAKVLGVSECSDLAVIEIDGSPIPTLSWFSGTNAPGTEVYVAGFPLGDPEYTLTRGVISKERAGGDTSWASIDHAIEHDASSQPGNSGGPLVTADTLVAGVHYASSAQTNQSQFYAIAADVAKPIVEELAAGTDVDSVGINGQIVSNEDGSITGLWVSGVKSGSPADEAGVQPGDIVTRIEGVSVGLDGTMRDYCDVLRSHNADDQLAIEVLRYSTAEVLDGELNGDSLVTSFSFAEELGDDATSGEAYADYMTVTDDTGSITVQVPTAWAQVDGAPIDLGDGVASPSIVASPDINGYRTTWSTPGMEFLASTTLAGTSAGDMLDLVTPADCDSLGRTDYDDGFFVGQYENFVSCGGTDTEYVVVATNSVDGQYGVLVAVQVVTVADYEALDQIMRSFN